MDRKASARAVKSADTKETEDGTRITQQVLENTAMEVIVEFARDGCKSSRKRPVKCSCLRIYHRNKKKAELMKEALIGLFYEFSREKSRRQHYRRLVKHNTGSQACQLVVELGEEKGVVCQYVGLAFFARLPNDHAANLAFRRLDEVLYDMSRGGLRQRVRNRVLFHLATNFMVKTYWDPRAEGKVLHKTSSAIPWTKLLEMTRLSIEEREAGGTEIVPDYPETANDWRVPEYIWEMAARDTTCASDEESALKYWTSQKPRSIPALFSKRHLNKFILCHEGAYNAGVVSTKEVLDHKGVRGVVRQLPRDVFDFFQQAAKVLPKGGNTTATRWVPGSDRNLVYQMYTGNNIEEHFRCATADPGLKALALANPEVLAKFHLFLSDLLQAAMRHNGDKIPKGKFHFCYRTSHMATMRYFPQPAHYDYPDETEMPGVRENSYIAFWGWTPAGQELQVFPEEMRAELLHISGRQILCVKGTTIHAGGLGDENLRGHVYLYPLVRELRMTGAGNRPPSNPERYPIHKLLTKVSGDERRRKEDYAGGSTRANKRKKKTGGSGERYDLGRHFYGVLYDDMGLVDGPDAPARVRKRKAERDKITKAARAKAKQIQSEKGRSTLTEEEENDKLVNKLEGRRERGARQKVVSYKDEDSSEEESDREDSKSDESSDQDKSNKGVEVDEDNDASDARESGADSTTETEEEEEVLDKKIKAKVTKREGRGVK